MQTKSVEIQNKAVALFKEQTYEIMSHHSIGSKYFNELNNALDASNVEYIHLNGMKKQAKILSQNKAISRTIYLIFSFLLVPLTFLFPYSMIDTACKSISNYIANMISPIIFGNLIETMSDCAHGVWQKVKRKTSLISDMLQI